MRVRFKQTITTAREVFRRGRTYEMSADDAVPFLRPDVADIESAPEEAISRGTYTLREAKSMIGSGSVRSGPTPAPDAELVGATGPTEDPAKLDLLAGLVAMNLAWAADVAGPAAVAVVVPAPVSNALPAPGPVAPAPAKPQTAVVKRAPSAKGVKRAMKRGMLSGPAIGVEITKKG